MPLRAASNPRSIVSDAFHALCYKQLRIDVRCRTRHHGGRIGASTSEDGMGGIDADTLYGTLNLLVLQALRDGPLHGLAVSRRLAGTTRGTVRVEEGALYPALHRLERDGLVRGEWGHTEENRRVKFYRLTRKGRRRLEQETARWARHAEAVAAVLGLPAGWAE